MAILTRDALIKRNIVNKNGAMSFDTTSSITGSKLGTTVFLQKFYLKD